MIAQCYAKISSGKGCDLTSFVSNDVSLLSKSLKRKSATSEFRCKIKINPKSGLKEFALDGDSHQQPGGKICLRRSFPAELIAFVSKAHCKL